MGRAKWIGIAVGVAAILVVGSVAANLYALSNLQVRPYGATPEGLFGNMDNVDMFDLSVDMQMEACNPTPIPASFDRIDMDITYKTTKIATGVLWGEWIPPNASTVIDGRASLEGSALVGLLLGALASAFSGESGFDPDEMVMNITLHTSVLGVFPFSVSQQVTEGGPEYLFAGTDSWDCKV